MSDAAAAALRPQGGRVRPAPRRPVRRHAARRLRRRRGQDRGAARRRPDARLGPAAPQRPLPLVVDPRPQQALRDAQPAHGGGPGARAPAVRRRPTSWSRTSAPARWRSGAWAPTTSTPSTRAPSTPASRATARPGATATAPGFASAGEALGGLRYINGYPGQAPPRSGISLGDTLAAQSAFQGILLALYARDVHGAPGQTIDASITDACFAMTESAVLEYEQTGFVREPTGPRLPRIAPSNVYRSIRRQVGRHRRQPRHAVEAARGADGAARSWARTRASTPTTRAASTRTSSTS